MRESVPRIVRLKLLRLIFSLPILAISVLVMPPEKKFPISINTSPPVARAKNPKRINFPIPPEAPVRRVLSAMTVKPFYICFLVMISRFKKLFPFCRVRPHYRLVMW